MPGMARSRMITSGAPRLGALQPFGARKRFLDLVALLRQLRFEHVVNADVVVDEEQPRTFRRRGAPVISRRRRISRVQSTGFTK